MSLRVPSSITSAIIQEAVQSQLNKLKAEYVATVVKWKALAANTLPSSEQSIAYATELQERLVQLSSSIKEKVTPSKPNTPKSPPTLRARTLSTPPYTPPRPAQRDDDDEKAAPEYDFYRASPAHRRSFLLNDFSDGLLEEDDFRMSFVSPPHERDFPHLEELPALAVQSVTTFIHSHMGPKEIEQEMSHRHIQEGEVLISILESTNKNHQGRYDLSNVFDNLRTALTKSKPIAHDDPNQPLSLQEIENITPFLNSLKLIFDRLTFANIKSIVELLNGEMKESLPLLLRPIKHGLDTHLMVTMYPSLAKKFLNPRDGYKKSHLMNAYEIIFLISPLNRATIAYNILNLSIPHDPHINPTSRFPKQGIDLEEVKALTEIAHSIQNDEERNYFLMYIATYLWLEQGDHYPQATTIIHNHLKTEGNLNLYQSFMIGQFLSENVPTLPTKSELQIPSIQKIYGWILILSPERKPILAPPVRQGRNSLLNDRENQ